MHIIAALTEPASIRSYLEGVGLPARPPPIGPVCPSPQHELESPPDWCRYGLIRGIPMMDPMRMEDLLMFQPQYPWWREDSHGMGAR